MSYECLFEPLQIKNHTLRSRFVMGPHQWQFDTYGDGTPTEAWGDFLLERARSGLGLCIVSGGAAGPNSLKPAMSWLKPWEDGTAEAWKPIAEKMKKEGVPMFGQLLHGGAQASNHANPDEVLWAPTSMLIPYWGETPKEMEEPDFDRCVEMYLAASRNLKAGGFDGIEISAAHGYLLSQFMSPFANRRTDDYGGSVENRMRLLMRILKAVKDEVGPDMVLGVRMQSTDRIDNGFDFEDSKEMAKRLEDSGLVDYLSVTQGVHSSVEFIRAPIYVKPGYAAEWAGTIKKSVSKLPVLAVGRMANPDVIKACIEEGNADAVILVRELMADAHFVAKVKEGRSKEIRRCIGSEDCIQAIRTGVPVSCTFNAEMGKERLVQNQTKSSAKVLVIGGGPGGLEAARVAASRGAKVTIMEASDKIGGGLNRAAGTPGREEFNHIVDYFNSQIERHGIEVKLNTKATVDAVKAHAPDTVIVATGALSLMPPAAVLPKIEMDAPNKLISVEACLDRDWKKGEKAVIIDGEGYTIALSIAEILSEKGVGVTLVSDNKPGLRVGPATGKMWLQRLGKAGVEFMPLWRLHGVDEKGAQLKHMYSAKIEGHDCDAVVYAYQRRTNDGLYQELQKSGGSWTIRRVGDCLTPRAIRFAINDGLLAGLAV